jgi:alkylation response protein AidB-like acyl-CoA dehydrogenase
MQRQLDECVAYARKREQFGKPIGKFQSVSNRIVDMSVRLETSRMLVQKFAWKKTMGAKEATTEASMAKLHVTESFLANSLDAVRIFGAQGYIEDSLHERDLRDAIAGPIFSGTNDIQRNILAQQMRL